jgi:hypothetical protein
MFIGHFAVAFAAKRFVPRVSLAALFAAAQLADLMWPALVAVGVEQVRIDPGNTVFTPLDFVSYPWSHSLMTLLVWSALFGLGYREATGHNGRAVAVLALLVGSHWVLDFVTHRPDMPLYPGGPRVGLGLWNSISATLVIEGGMYAVGVWVYMRVTQPRDAVGHWSFVAMVIALVVLYLLSVVSGAPPSVAAVWIAGVAGGALLLVWGWWTDHHRVSTRR